MRIACRITTVTDTHSEYVIHFAFPLQQRLQERASVLHLYVNYLSYLRFGRSALPAMLCGVRIVGHFELRRHKLIPVA